ncbi:hypothetical protein PCASD_01875 [Puccinia coronata f. sp. avenae]|uniref:CxC6 like cysteine cluster associated with KDZ domain-containing protein n=1 Tax=Puccinia coronata f. sp. avenae TaxID=200324 RepID=A0A2N5VJK4_9BASI|nr:hypothetical protein PCASD_01875 [Puccinia coronata f. sp. avenae]
MQVKSPAIWSLSLLNSVASRFIPGRTTVKHLKGCEQKQPLHTVFSGGQCSLRPGCRKHIGQKTFWDCCGECHATTSAKVQHPYCLLHTAEENRVPADTLEHAQGCLAIDHPQTVFEPET